MTQGQKEQINTLREQGNGYKRIAGILGVSVNTIASYCRRKTAVCPCCGAALVMTPKHRKKKFCSDACRLKWWYANSEKLNKKANYDCTCQFCGKVFVSYGNKNRKVLLTQLLRQIKKKSGTRSCSTRQRCKF